MHIALKFDELQKELRDATRREKEQELREFQLRNNIRRKESQRVILRSLLDDPGRAAARVFEMEENDRHRASDERLKREVSELQHGSASLAVSRLCEEIHNLGCTVSQYNGRMWDIAGGLTRLGPGQVQGQGPAMAVVTEHRSGQNDDVICHGVEEGTVNVQDDDRSDPKRRRLEHN